MKSRPTVSGWRRSALLFLLAPVLASILSAGCSQADGSACNPALSHDECDNAPTVQCVQPSAPTCYGQAYCCTVDSNGNITDTTPNCQYLVQCQNASTEDGGALDGGSEAGADATMSMDTGMSVDTGMMSIDTGSTPETGGDDSSSPVDSAVMDATGTDGG